MLISGYVFPQTTLEKNAGTMRQTLDNNYVVELGLLNPDFCIPLASADFQQKDA